MDEFFKIIANNIRNRRTELGISQDILAESAKLGRSHIGKIERMEQRPNIETLYKIAKVLKIEPYKLLKP